MSKATIKKMAKIIMLLSLIFGVLLLNPIMPAEQAIGKSQAYTFGDALNYNGVDYITSANSGIAG